MESGSGHQKLDGYPVLDSFSCPVSLRKGFVSLCGVSRIGGGIVYCAGAVGHNTTRCRTPKGELVTSLGVRLRSVVVGSRDSCRVIRGPHGTR
jgi:hypothetical protein